MNFGKRPLSILILACLYIAIGAMGFAYHLPGRLSFHHEDVWIEGTEMLAIVAGVFMLLRHNWARWLALAWMAVHVAISFPVVRKMAIHLFFVAVVAWLLFQSRADRYFGSKGKETSSN